MKQEIESIEEGTKELQDNVNTCRKEMQNNRKKLELNLKVKENTKAWGQPLYACIDQILYKNGIKRSAMFGSTLQGNDCR